MPAKPATRADGFSVLQTREERQRIRNEQLEQEQRARIEAERIAREEAERKRQEEEKAAIAELAALENDRRRTAEASQEAARVAIAEMEKVKKIAQDAVIATETGRKPAEEGVIGITEKKAAPTEDELVEISKARIKAKKDEAQRVRNQRLEEAEKKDKMEEELRRASYETQSRRKTEEERRDAEVLAAPGAASAAAEQDTKKNGIGKSNGQPGDKNESTFSEKKGINGDGVMSLMPTLTAFSEREEVGFNTAGGDPKTKRRLECPQSLYTDSYKLSHPLQYPNAKEMSAYGEFRGNFKGMEDDRIVVYGMRYYMSQFVSCKMDKNDTDRSREFVATHLKDCAGINSCFDAIDKNDGFYPVKIEVMPEGSVVRPHIPVYKITATTEDGRDYSRLVTYLETMLTMIWYPSTVATLSRITKELIRDAYENSVDPSSYVSLDSRLHDFGFRGCTCLEQSVIGGSAHLLSFTGSDTMSACYHVQYHLNSGICRGTSLPATEHSVMTSWPDEETAVRNLLAKFPTSPFIACVMDSYDYEAALNQVLPIVAKIFKEDKAKALADSKPFVERTFVIRPDSGDPVEQVLKGLSAGEVAFGLKKFDGSERNSKGFKVLQNCAVIQGDGIDYEIISDVLRAVLAAGFSAENVAFGMGAGLLQKVNRDTMQFATKLSYIKYANGVDDYKNVMKAPKGQKSKWSLPGKSVVMKKIISKDAQGSPLVYGPHIVCTEEYSKILEERGYVPSMITVYDNGKDVGNVNFYTETFQDIIDRMEKEWEATRGNESAVHSSLVNLQKDEASKITAIVIANKARAVGRVDSLFDTVSVSRQLVWKLDHILNSV